MRRLPLTGCRLPSGACTGEGAARRQEVERAPHPSSTCLASSVHHPAPQAGLSTHLQQHSFQAHEQLDGGRQHPQHAQQLLQAACHLLS